MSLQRKFRLILIITALASLTFLVYVANLYFDVYTLVHNLHISIIDVNIIHQDSSVFVETVFFLENPSKFHMNISYVQKKVYLDPNYELRVDDRDHNYIGGSNKIVAVVPPFSNGSLPMRVQLIGDLPSNNSAIWFLVYMRIINVPLVDHFGFELPLSWSF